MRSYNFLLHSLRLGWERHTVTQTERQARSERMKKDEKKDIEDFHIV